MSDVTQGKYAPKKRPKQRRDRVSRQFQAKTPKATPRLEKKGTDSILVVGLILTSLDNFSYFFHKSS